MHDGGFEKTGSSSRTRGARGECILEILKAEIRYNRFGYLIFLASVPLLVALEAHGSYTAPHFLVWFMAFMMVNHWNVGRIREKRDFQLAQLPVAACDIGIARALVVILSAAAYLLLYVIVRRLFGPLELASPLMLLWLFGSVVTLFSLILMLRDRYLNTRALRHGKIMVFAAAGVLFAAGLYAALVFDNAREAGDRLPLIIRGLEYLVERDPFGHPLVTLGFVGVSLLLSYLSVVTFGRRVTNIE